MKNVILCGTDRLKKDFLYLFPKARVVGSVSLNKLEENESGNSICTIKQVNKRILKNRLLVLCMRKDDKIDKRFKKIGLKEKRNYYWLEDIAYMLNDKKDERYYRKAQKIDSKNKDYHMYLIKSFVTNQEMVKKMIYTDSINGFKCTKPFTYMHIQPNGCAYSCCPGYADYNIAGSLLNKSTSKIWNSNAIKIMRLSIINKTYAFCNKLYCPYLKEEYEKVDTRFDDLTPSIDPEEVYVSIDRSCNLKCKSCRNEYYNPPKIHRKNIKRIADKLVNSSWTSNAKRLVFAGQGEVFFSKIYKKMVFDSKITKRDSIEILTNGTLMTKDKLDKLTEIYSNIQIYISIDAATEETYKKLRIGGNFKMLIENLEYLSKLRKEGLVKKVELSFVVQKENYKEMIEIIKLKKRLGFDKVNFQLISNWGTYTDEEFKNISMLKSNGSVKEELKNLLKDPIFKEEKYEHSNVSKFI